MHLNPFWNWVAWDTVLKPTKPSALYNGDVLGAVKLSCVVQWKSRLSYFSHFLVFLICLEWTFLEKNVQPYGLVYWFSSTTSDDHSSPLHAFFKMCWFFLPIRSQFAPKRSDHCRKLDWSLFCGWARAGPVRALLPRNHCCLQQQVRQTKCCSLFTISESMLLW